MSCPTCDHTMQLIGQSETWWCPRCGTIKSRLPEVIQPPKLVENCRSMLEYALEQRTSHGGLASGMSLSLLALCREQGIIDCVAARADRV